MHGDDIYSRMDSRGESPGRRKRARAKQGGKLTATEQEIVGDIVYAFTRIGPVQWDADGFAMLNDELRGWAKAQGITPTKRLARAAYEALGLEEYAP